MTQEATQRMIHTVDRGILRAEAGLDCISASILRSTVALGSSIVSNRRLRSLARRHQDLRILTQSLLRLPIHRQNRCRCGDVVRREVRRLRMRRGSQRGKVQGLWRRKTGRSNRESRVLVARRRTLRGSKIITVAVQRGKSRVDCQNQKRMIAAQRAVLGQSRGGGDSGGGGHQRNARPVLEEQLLTLKVRSRGDASTTAEAGRSFVAGGFVLGCRRLILASWEVMMDWGGSLLCLRRKGLLELGHRGLPMLRPHLPEKKEKFDTKE